jgi:hypothetical protein
MSSIKELEELITVNLYMSPCTEEELAGRDFLNGIALFNVQRMVCHLEKEAIYYIGDVLHIYKEWAKKNLKGYELDFRSDRQKEIDGMSDFAKTALNIRK